MKLTDLTPDPHNANAGTERGLRALDDSMRGLGAGRSIVVDKNGVVVAGNKTLERAIDAGLVDAQVVKTRGETVVVVQRDDWDLMDDNPNNPARRYAYADNRVAQLDLAWTPDILYADVLAGFEFDGLFTQTELRDLFDTLDIEDGANAGVTDEDAADELRDKWGTERGQLWQVGKHRIMCADSADAAAVEVLTRGHTPDGVISDPPYAFGLASTMNESAKSGGWHDMMNNAAWFQERYNQWKRLIGAGVIWVFGNWRTLPILMRGAHDAKVGINSVMVWYKDWIGPGGPLGLRPTYEIIALTVVGKRGIEARDVEDFYTSQWSSHKPSGHKAEKPEHLFRHLIKSSPGETFIDFFLGSGTLIAACEQTGRTGLGMEIEPAYVALALERLSAMGLEAAKIDS